jgi:hypothetical protein
LAFEQEFSPETQLAEANRGLTDIASKVATFDVQVWPYLPGRSSNPIHRYTRFPDLEAHPNVRKQHDHDEYHADCQYSD